VEETVRYNYRLRPGATAVAALNAEWGVAGPVNEAVHQQKIGTTLCTLAKMLTDQRAAIPGCGRITGRPAADAAHLHPGPDQSFKVKGRGRPVFKRRKTTPPSLEYTTRGFRVKNDRLVLAGGISIPVVWSRELPSDPSSVRVYRDSLGDWYASFVVRRTVEPAPEAAGRIGIDWGVTTTATTTEPNHDLPHPQYRKRCSAELARAQKKMSRRRGPQNRAPSNGYRRAKHQAAKLNKKAARQNTHTAHIWAKSVVDHHQLIAVEDFKPKFLAKSTMARKAADAAIGTTKRILIAGDQARSEPEIPCLQAWGSVKSTTSQPSQTALIAAAARAAHLIVDGKPVIFADTLAEPLLEAAEELLGYHRKYPWRRLDSFAYRSRSRTSCGSSRLTSPRHNGGSGSGWLRLVSPNRSG
jgi:putative transposase